MQIKSVGVVVLLFAVMLVTSWLNPLFLSAENVKSLMKWTSLFGFISLGVAMVIMTGGIDLSIGSVIALSGVCMLLLLNQHFVDMEETIKITRIEKVAVKNQQLPKVFLENDSIEIRADDQLRFTNAFGVAIQSSVVRVERENGELALVMREPESKLVPNSVVNWFQYRRNPIWFVIPAVLIGSSLIGLFHGWLVTKVKLQPFVVTMCGLLGYRGLARLLANDQSLGLGSTMVNIKEWINGVTISLPVPGMPFVSSGHWHTVVWNTKTNSPLIDASGNSQSVAFVSWVDIPTTLVLLAITTFVLWIAVNRTTFGRYLMALGNNAQAAKYSGISTDRIIISTYVLCSMLAGLTGILLVFDLNTIEPSQTGSIYEMYAVAAAVIGGCSLRGGNGSIVGVIVGTAVTRALFLSIKALGIKASWEYVIIALALLAAVLTDELIRIISDQRKLRIQAKKAQQQ